MSIFHQPWKLVQNQIRSPGGYAMDLFRGVPDPKDIPNGSEAWVGSVTKANGANESCPNFGCAEVILPDGKKMYLFEAIDMAPEEILGNSHMARFGKGLGMLVKLLDAKNQYFLQAHPTRPTAKKLWNSDYGKEEAWFILPAYRQELEEPPYLLLGFKPGITKENFISLFHNGTLADLDALCHKIQVQPGETYFVPGGLAHALGQGNLVIEIQEPSDLAVVALPQQALIDYRRKAAPNGVFLPEDNEVYEQRMFETFHFTPEEETQVLERSRSRQPLLRSGDWGQEYLLIGKEQTPYFSCTKVVVKGSMPLHNTGEIRIGIVIRGSGQIQYPGGTMDIRQGEEIFFPYDIPDAYLTGDLEVFFANPAGADY